ncbi:MAG: FAD-dependent protein, partial [Polyangiaceae bacterium]
MTAQPRQLTIEIGLDEPQDDANVRRVAARKLGVRAQDLPLVVLRKRSLDCRGRRIRFHLLLDVLVGNPGDTLLFGLANDEELAAPHPREVTLPARVVVVGDGPCGLFCAYQLARQGIASIVLDRGKPVQPRRHDLRGLTQLGRVDPDSNYCFGEGGAGTYSDGKLYTRSHKRGDVRDVLEILALHQAPREILVDARPHIGSNRLPVVIDALRERLEGVGVVFRFGARVTELLTRQGSSRSVTGVRLQDGTTIEAEHVVLATGHSARDVYTLLARAGQTLEPKAFALGVRIEHPQALINEIQYGKHAADPRLPSAAYKLADSADELGTFSFCMCPGGFIVPAATEPGEVVVNGMSPSKRNSRYANSGLVVGIDPALVAGAGYRGVLGGIELQSAIEHAAFEAGGAMLEAPATRVTDFLAGRASSTVPSSSYQPGLTPTDVGAVLARSRLPLAERLRAALRRFGSMMPGYVSEEAVLVGVESRTSAPVRIPRHPETLESLDIAGLYPGGEGAGYAGGIVS